MWSFRILKFLKPQSESLLYRRYIYKKSIHQHVENRKLSIQEEMLSKAIQNNKLETVGEWISLKNSVLNGGRNITDVNFDAKVMSFCVAHKNYEAAKSFLNYFKSQNLRPNDATLGKFLRLYYACYYNNRNAVQDEENKILNIYNEFKKSYALIPPTLAENIIHGLSVTKQWKDCLKLLGDLKSNENPSASTYSAIITAAFHNDQDDIGWNLLKEMISTQKLPLPIVYETWMKKSAGKVNLKANVHLLLSYLKDNDIKPSKDVTDTLLDVLSPISYHGVYTTITTRGVCRHCQRTLQHITINEDDFEKLRNAFMEKVIIGKNIFHKTTPEELNHFKEFINSVGPFDVVIDGLNVAYSAGNRKPLAVYAKLLSDVVTYLTGKSNNILVLGRKHMKKWPKMYMNDITSKAHLFLAEDLSKDDPFLLFATMASGLGTKFLSKDFMRGHMYLLMDENLKRIFRRWQQLHQYIFIYAESNHKITVKPPFPYLTTVQESVNGWHIPYVKEHMAKPPLSLEAPKQWLCIQKQT